MTCAVLFDFTPYRLKAANSHEFGPARWWDHPAKDDNSRPWWEEKPAKKDTEKPASNASFWDWLTK